MRYGSVPQRSILAHLPVGSTNTNEGRFVFIRSSLPPDSDTNILARAQLGPRGSALPRSDPGPTVRLLVPRSGPGQTTVDALAYLLRKPNRGPRQNQSQQPRSGRSKRSSTGASGRDVGESHAWDGTQWAGEPYSVPEGGNQIGITLCLKENQDFIV